MPRKGKTAMRQRDLPRPLDQQAAHVQKIANRAHVADEHVRTIMAMMDPGSLGQSGADAPSRAAWLRSTTCESISGKLSLADGSIQNSGAFQVSVQADPYNTVILNTTTSDVEDAQEIRLSAVVQNVVASGLNIEQFDRLVVSHNNIEAVSVVDGVVGQVVPFISAGGGTRKIIMASSTVELRMRYTPYTGTLGALVAGTTVNVTATLLGSAETSITLPANTTYLGVAYDLASDKFSGHKGSVGSSITSGTANVAISPSHRTVSLQTLSGIEKLRAYRITGQSVLLTYTGSSINNGGDIAIARVSTGWTPDPGLSVYDSILKLPKSRRYVGRIAKGAHCFWIPQSVQDYEPRVYGVGNAPSDHPSYKMVAAGALDDATESVLYQVETMVEFQSDQPSYAAIEYAPPWNSFDVALLALAAINPCGENNAHLKRVARWGSKKARELLARAIDDPAATAALIAKLAALIGSVSGL